MGKVFYVEGALLNGVTSKILPKDFIEIKKQYLLDIKSVVKFEEIPESTGTRQQ